MRVSVIIPSYNRAHLLGRAIASVQAQTLKPLEIIVVDDGSTDASAELVTRQFPDCHYLHQSNRGVSAARNLGIRVARGEWIAFLDSDDEWLPEKLAAQAAVLAATSGCRLVHADEVWIRRGRRVNAMQKHRKSGGDIFQQCLPLCVISPSAAVLHRSLLEEVGGFDESLPACEDYDLWLRICAREAVAFVETPQLRKFGGHADQLSRQYWGMDRFRVRALEKLLQAECLSPENYAAVLKTLIKKTGILAQGARKRGKNARARFYAAKQNRYREALMDIAAQRCPAIRSPLSKLAAGSDTQ